MSIPIANIRKNEKSFSIYCANFLLCICAIGQVVAYRIGEKWGVSFFLEPDSWAPEEGCAIEDAGKVIELFECKYDAVDSWYDECYYLSLSLNGKYGCFSVSRKDGSVTMVCEHKYDEISFDADGMVAVRIGEKWGYIDKDGDEI